MEHSRSIGSIGETGESSTTDCRLTNNHHQPYSHLNALSAHVTWTGGHNSFSAAQIKQRRSQSVSLAAVASAAELTLSRKTMRKLQQNRKRSTTRLKAVTWTGEKVINEFLFKKQNKF